ncbi:Asp-tRNA(Asn)/Glu-tRNA(Gln) amidotransferase GatCAB subunit B, partial [Candidatus Uhrbacteria bacterium]|nr:Asp-tRNA(Asn)/Glu-tRNA(Gln) amidotransferase GatCAB subunit B [Candidatus Uhrbacteria bacterium]
MKLESIIGLEIHVQLKTKSKMFCSCQNGVEAPPNSAICPLCMGHPGTLPVPNKTAVEMGVMAALALNCTINEESKFDRKN